MAPWTDKQVLEAIKRKRKAWEADIPARVEAWAEEFWKAETKEEDHGESRHARNGQAEQTP